MIERRLATTADAAAIRDLSREAYAKWVPVVGREPRPMTADYEAAVRSHRFDLLHEDGTLLALVETIARPDHLLVENVAVRPDFQGRGLGRRLMALAEEIAREAGYEEIRLYTNQRFVENIALYRRLGYVVTGEEALAVGVITHMAKRIGQRSSLSA